ncbi:MAG: hypothetical protein AB7Q97_15455 [Gammaproteobacteria bacterium]
MVPGIRAAAALFACTATVSAVAEGDTLHRLVVSYGSACCTADPQMHAPIEALIAGFEKAHGVRLASTRVAWGVDGNQKQCFALAELDPAQQAELVRRLKDLTGTSFKTFIRENAPCDVPSGAPPP